MSNSLGSLLIELGINSAGFVEGLDKATYKSKQAAQQIGASFKGLGDEIGTVLGQFGEVGNVLGEALSGVGQTISKVAGEMGSLGGSAGIAVIGITALGGAAVAAGAGLVEMAMKGAEVVHALDMASEKTGISIQNLQGLQAAGSTVGLSLDNMVMATRKFSQALTGTGKGASLAGTVLRQLGVTSHDTNEAMLEVADAFEKMPNGAQKAADAVALFGREGLNLIPLLNKGRDGLKEFNDVATAYGPKIGTEAVDATHKLEDANVKLSQSWDRLTVAANSAASGGIADIKTSMANLNKEMADTIEKSGFLATAWHLITQSGQFARDFKPQVAGASDKPSDMFSKLDDLHKNDSAKRLADTLAEWHAKNAGGEAQLKLEQQLTAIADAKVAIAQGDTEQNERTLNSLQQQLPLLQAAAAAERLAADEATRRAASHAAFEKSLANMPHPYAAPTPKKQPDTSGLFGPQPGIQAPREFENVGPTGGDAGQALSTALTSSFGTAKGALTDFYDDWKGKQAQTADSITDSYNDQLKHFQDLLKNQAISQQQFDTVRIQLETQLQGQLKELRKNTGASTMEDAFNDMFNDVENSGRDFARSLTADIGGALNGLNEQIAKFAVTGKGLNLEKLGSSFMENMTSTVLKKGESAALGAFGLGGARDGSSAMNALFVTNADTSLSKSLSGFTGGSVGGALPAVAGGFNPLSLLSFLPGFAEGGDFDAGHSFIAGEKGPELITPRRSGTVHPNGSKIGGDTHYHAHVTFNGVTDHDSFKRNQGQLMNQITAAQARASRNS